MKLRGRNVVLYGDFSTLGRDEAVRRLQAAGARVTDAVTEETDLIFLAFGERGPIPRTDTMLKKPFFDEAALAGMLEREEGVAPSAPALQPFLPPGALESAGGADALRALLDGADWSAFVPERDLPPLRARLEGLEHEAGVADVHRLATQRLVESGARLLHSYGHDVEIVAHALSPDGRYLATGSWVGDDYDAGGVLQIWEVASGRCVHTVDGVMGGVGWPDYARSIQWSADSSRVAVAHCTNMVGVWKREGSEPLATIDVSDGNSRPSEYALSPDGRSAYYHCGTNGDGGLQGCLVPVGRGVLRWLPNHVDGDHPYLMARSLPDGVRRAFDENDSQEDDGFKVGQWIERPVWSPDGTRLFGSNAISVDAETRQVVWYAPAKIAELSPDGRRVAVVTHRGLFFRDASDGRILCGPFALGKPGSLHWAPGTDRLAVLTPVTIEAPPSAHIFDGERHVSSLPLLHPEWEFDERWTGDRNPWAWAPGGERAACLTLDGVEVWSFADPRDPQQVNVLSAGDADAVYWGANDTLVLVDARNVRFVRADTGEEVGDFTFLRVPPGPRPVEGDVVAEILSRQIFALDEDTWAMTLKPDVVIAPSDSEDELDSVLTWAVGHRHAWPVRWGGLRVLPDARAAADVLDSEDGELLRAFQEELQEPMADPAEWPPPNTAGLDDLYEVARRCATSHDQDRWGFAIGRNLRAAARLRARHGAPDGALTLVDGIPDPMDVIAAASDIAVIFARAGWADQARAAYARAESRVVQAAGKPMNADTASSFAAACQAMGNARAAGEWFRYARTAITVEPNPWEDHLAVLYSMLECGRDDLAREILADRDGHPPVDYASEPEWLVYLLRSGRMDLAYEFQSLPGWEVPYEVLHVLAEAGRPDLLKTWGDHNWAVSDERVEQAHRAAAAGTPPVRPLAPTAQDLAELSEGYAEILRTPHSRREHPTELLIERAAACGHFSAVLDLLELLPHDDEFNGRTSSAFTALWVAHTGFNRAPW